MNQSYFKLTLKPFFITFRLAWLDVKHKRGYVLIAAFGGYHDFVNQLAEGYDFGVWGPQTMKMPTGAETFKGLQWRKPVKYAIERAVNQV